MHDITLVKLKKKEGGLEVRSLSPYFAISCWLSAFELWFAWGGTVSQQGSALCPWTAEGRYPQPCSHVFCSFKECFRNLQGTELMGFPCCHYLWKGAMGNSCSRPVRLCAMIFWQHCRKKGVFFHLISNACLVMLGRGWCSGLFLFFFSFILLLCYRYTRTAGISWSGLQAGTWCVITKSGQEHQQSLCQPFHYNENRRAEPLSGHITKGYLTSKPTGSPDFY